jgi:hypothetical protein
VAPAFCRLHADTIAFRVNAMWQDAGYPGS